MTHNSLISSKRACECFRAYAYVLAGAQLLQAGAERRDLLVAVDSLGDSIAALRDEGAAATAAHLAGLPKSRIDPVGGAEVRALLADALAPVTLHVSTLAAAVKKLGHGTGPSSTARRSSMDHSRAGHSPGRRLDLHPAAGGGRDSPPIPPSPPPQSRRRLDAPTARRGSVSVSVTFDSAGKSAPVAATAAADDVSWSVEGAVDRSNLGNGPGLGALQDERPVMAAGADAAPLGPLLRGADDADVGRSHAGAPTGGGQLSRLYRKFIASITSEARGRPPPGCVDAVTGDAWIGTKNPDEVLAFGSRRGDLSAGATPGAGSSGKGGGTAEAEIVATILQRTGPDGKRFPALPPTVPRSTASGGLRPRRVGGPAAQPLTAMAGSPHPAIVSPITPVELGFRLFGQANGDLDRG